MSSRLERLLEDIDPSRTIDDIENRINNAFAKYYRDNNTVDSWEEVEPLLGQIFRTLENAVMRIQFKGRVDFDGSRAIHLLSNAYGSSKVVYDIMLSGAEGGIYGVLRTLARVMAEEYSQNEIGTRVIDYWNDLSVDEQLAAPEEYIRLYGHLLPSHIKEKAYRMQPFWKFLEKHPKMLKELRSR